MSDIEDVKQCPNCKLDILTANFTIHYVHCQRNFYLCAKCEEPVNYDNKTEHDETNHVIIQCSNCQLALEKCLLNDHLINNCPDRKVKCQICDIDIKAVDVTDHEDYCGSRTEKCPECNEFVMLKYKSLHLDSNHTFIKLSDEPGPSPSWQYGRRTLCNFLPDLSTKNIKSSAVQKKKSNETLGRLRHSGSSQSRDKSDEMTKKKLHLLFCDIDDQAESKAVNDFRPKTPRKLAQRDADEWPVLSGLKSLNISEEKEEGSTASRASFSPNDLNENSDLMYALQVSHEINSGAWKKHPTPEAEVLKNRFMPCSENKSSMGKSVEKDMFEDKTKKIVRKPDVDAFNKDFNYLYDKHESVKLPCEFCGNLIVSNNLILHQRRCILLMADNRNMQAAAAFGMSYFDEDVEKKIPCGTCNKFFRLSLLENHQLNCKRNSSKSSKAKNFSKNLKAVSLKSESGLQNGLEPSSPQFSSFETTSEWLSESSKRNQESQNIQNSLNHPDSGVINRTSRVSRKSRRAQSPPAR